jgi:heme-degrading monooxygenase HmoA
MIVRTWRGLAPVSNPQAYARHFRGNVLPELRKLNGFLGAILLRENRAEDVEFLVLTKWASMDAVRAFAGDDVSKAVVEPEAVASLIGFDATVRHYEVVEEDPAPG